MNAKKTRNRSLYHLYTLPVFTAGNRLFLYRAKFQHYAIGSINIDGYKYM